MKKIRNIIFDFGGVIYQIDHARQIEAFKKLGIQNFESQYSQAMQSPLFAQFERGELSPEEVRQMIKIFLGKKDIEIKQIDEAWNSILTGFRMSSVKLLEGLRKNYNLFLLSNTNAIHYEIFIKEFFDQYGYDFDDLFTKSYWSFKIGMRKPDAEIYRFVLQDSGINSLETIFIDDTLKNVEASIEAGLPAMLLKPGVLPEYLFDKNLNLKSS
jgi:glucose-1-phosphatase